MKLSQKASRRALGSIVALAAVALFAACVPEAPPSTTTPTSTAPSTVRTVTDGTLTWTISQEANNGVFNGSVNYWNAGTQGATSAAGYVATHGDVTVQKKNAAGNFVNIGSESSVSWANRNRNGAGTAVTAFNTAFLDQRIVLSGGEGTVNTATGVSTVQWTGTFTLNFYGELVPFQVANPRLTVDAAGNGTLTATLSGVAKDMADPEAPGTVLPATQVTLANLPDVYGAANYSTTFTNPTGYLGTAVTTPAGSSSQAAQSPANASYWGSWPQSFVDFQQATGLSSYWYTSGLSIDPHKVTAPVTVNYNVAP